MGKISKKEWKKKSKVMNTDEVDMLWQESYNRQAEKYDKKRTIEGQKIFDGFVDDFLDELIPAGNDIKVLDVATGTGKISLPLAEKGRNVIGIDLTENMLREAQKKARDKSLKNISLQLANARELPFEDSSFDCVMSRRFFHLIPNRLRRPIIEEMIRVSKPGALIILEFSNPFYGVFAELYKRLFKQKISIYIWPSQTKRLFSELKIIKKLGTYLPLTKSLLLLNKSIGMFYLNLCRFVPFVYLSSEIYYVLMNEKKVK